jgi:hypothetical protein
MEGHRGFVVNGTVIRPEVVGCFKCGASKPPGAITYAQCPACGKTVGICAGCAWGLSLETRPFLLESVAWHIEQRHPMVAMDVNRLMREAQRESGRGMRWRPRSAAGGAQLLVLKGRTSW